jgi:hypothetical protein
MYEFSRAIYREVAGEIDASVHGCRGAAHAHVLRRCEAAIERLATDRHYFARPARTLFNDIRMCFPMQSQARVFAVVEHYLAAADAHVAAQPRCGVDANGEPLRCRATTRRGTPCQRDPLPHNGYCPSHQHLAETEQIEVGDAVGAAEPIAA